MSKYYILGVDLGTSSLKAVLFDENFEQKAITIISYPCNHPEPDYADQNALWWWDAFITAAKEIIEKSKIPAENIACIGIDSQGSAALPIDRDGNPLHPALLWQDRRSQKQKEKIDKIIDKETFFEITGQTNDSGNFGPKILWFKEEKPDIYKKTYKFLHANGYLVYKLTNVATIDTTNIALTEICDTKNCKWSDKILNELGLDKNKMPDIFNSTDIVGKVTKQASIETTLCEGTPVVAGLMDALACAVGSGISCDGDAYVTAGTVQGVGILRTTTDFCKDVHNHMYITKDYWVAMSGLDFSGGILRWFNELLDISNSDLDDLCEKSKFGDSTMFFLPYMVGQRTPLWNSNTRGVLFGLDPSIDRIKLVRTFIEGCGFAMRNVLDILNTNAMVPKEVVMTGGSTKMPLWNQVFSDINNIVVNIPNYKDVASLGAAITAGVGCNLTKLDDIKKHVKIDQCYKPDPKKYEIYTALYSMYKEILNMSIPLYDKLNEMRVYVNKIKGEI